MHIPDAVLDPRVAAATGVLGASGLVYALRKLERHLGERTTVLMGTMSAFVFACQMVNFPVGPGVTGHLLGGTLAAVLLGPWAGAVAIAAVLIVQCFLFGDGGLTALGANFLNMGLVGAVGGHAIHAPIRRMIGGPKGVLIGAMLAAWFSVILASGAFALEMAASGHRADFVRILTWMVLVHAAIGVGEALITGLALRYVLLCRPDLIWSGADEAGDDEADGRARAGAGALGTAFAGLAIAAAVAVFLGPFAWDAPDGLEFVGERIGFLKDAPPPPLPSPMADYQLTVPGLGHARAATALAGLVGTLVVFAVAWSMARVLPRAPSERAAVDAA